MQTSSLVPAVVAENAGTVRSSCSRALRGPKPMSVKETIFSRDQGDPAMEDPKLTPVAQNVRPTTVKVFLRTSGLFAANDSFVVNTNTSAEVPIARMSEVFRRHMLFIQERPTEIVDIGTFVLDADMYPHQVIDMVNRPNSSMMLAHIYACMSRAYMNTRNGFTADGTEYVCQVSILGQLWFVSVAFSHEEGGWVLDAYMVDDPIKVLGGAHFCCIC